MKIIILNVVIFFSLYCSIFYTLKKIDKNNIIKSILKINSLLDEEKLKKESNFFVKKYREIDTLIRFSRLKDTISFISVELMLILMLILSLISSTIIQIILNNIFLTIVVFITAALVPIIILRSIAIKNYDEIDDGLLNASYTMLNYAKEKNNLYYIIEKTAQYVPGVLGMHLGRFTDNINNGMEPEAAFMKLKDSVENKKFRQLIDNLQVANKKNSDFSVVLENNNREWQSYYEQKQERNSEINKGKSAIFLMLIVGAGVFIGLLGMCEDLPYILLNKSIGKIVVGYFASITLFTVCRVFKLRKFNY